MCMNTEMLLLDAFPKSVLNKLSFGWSNHFGYLIQRRLAYSFDAFEFLQKLSLRYSSYAFDRIKFRSYLTFASFVSMECNCKPVYFILNTCKEIEKLTKEVRSIENTVLLVEENPAKYPHIDAVSCQPFNSPCSAS